MREFLKDVWMHGGEESRAITPENITGEKGRAAMSASHLGVGRKGSCCVPLESGETITLADIEGPGIIRHIWMTVPDKTAAGSFVMRDLVLRFYWDDEETPSVECPIGDFFCNGFGERAIVNSMPICVNPTGGMNCYFEMPFRKHAKVTLTSEHPGFIKYVFYTFNYVLTDVPDDAMYFHARFNRERSTRRGVDYTVLDGVRGKGYYVGTYMALCALERYWWGEGEMKFYIDGDRDYPTQCSTGTEDYFGGAWSFGSMDEQGRMREKTYCTPFAGYPFYSRDDNFVNAYFMSECPPMRAFYRWHVMDPILFEKDLRVELQQIGVCERGLFERQDDVSSVAYWYQREPHAPFPALPGAGERWPR